jgi:hypothetical protein
MGTTIYDRLPTLVPGDEILIIDRLGNGHVDVAWPNNGEQAPTVATRDGARDHFGRHVFVAVNREAVAEGRPRFWSPLRHPISQADRYTREETFIERRLRDLYTTGCGVSLVQVWQERDRVATTAQVLIHGTIATFTADWDEMSSVTTVAHDLSRQVTCWMTEHQL